jgi:predicted MFS family arabinose efflux permease
MLVRAVSGFAAGIVFTSSSAAIADLVPYQRRGAAMGLLTASIFLAIPIGMPAAVALADAGNWRGIFVVQVATGIASFVSMARALPAGLGRGGAAVSQWRVLREPMIAPALLSVLLYTGAFFAAVQFVGTWLDAGGILPRARQGYLWVGLGLASAAGSAVLGGVADKVGKRRFVLVTTAAMAICFLLLARASGVVGLVALGLPIAVISASRSAALLALISELVEPRMRGTLMGIRAAAVNLGMGAFASVGGLVYEAYGYERFLQVGAAVMAIAYLLVRAFVREVR